MVDIVAGVHAAVSVYDEELATAAYAEMKLYAHSWAGYTHTTIE